MPTQNCEKALFELEVHGIKNDPAMVDRICRSYVKVTDNGYPVNLLPPYPLSRFEGCYLGTKGIIIYNDGDWKTLNHELRHAKDYLCY